MTVTRDDPQYLRDVLKRASAAVPTDLKSVSDTPMQADYVQIELVQPQRSSRLFAYEDQGKYYLEQPYQGVYEIDRALYELIVDGPASP